jgi:mono/diheme cytochrome c family protein
MRPFIVGAAIVALGVSGAAAQDHPGDPQAGYEYAARVCSTCHGISAEPSPMPQAPRFREVADQSGMTGTALRVWMETSHPTMPNIIVEKQDMLNVIAYILDLRGRDEPEN